MKPCDHPCWQTAIHESGHLYFFHLHPEWREIFGKHIRVTIFMPGVAILEGQGKPFSGPPKWIPVDVPREATRELSFVETEPALALTVAQSLLAGWAAVYADREEIPDPALPYFRHYDLVLGPDFQRATSIRMKLDDPSGRCTVAGYDAARKWAAAELHEQIHALQGDGLAAVRRCAEKILSKSDLSLSWPEAEAAFVEETKPADSPASRAACIETAETMNPFWQCLKPLKRLADVLRARLAMLRAGTTEDNTKKEIAP